MDWEKKTAHRAGLEDATRDTLNDMLTPGQSLLTKLQASLRMLHVACFSQGTTLLHTAWQTLQHTV